MRMTFTHGALGDLRSIRAYTLETWGVEQEERYLNRIWGRLESIRLDPTRYRLRADYKRHTKDDRQDRDNRGLA
jgi:plasmid stabilization system protein ParE